MLIANGAPQHVQHHGALLVDDGLVMFPEPHAQVDGAVPVGKTRLVRVPLQHLPEPVAADLPFDVQVRRVRRHGFRKPGVAVRLRDHGAAPPLVGEFVGQEAAEDMLHFRVHVGVQARVQAEGILEVQAPQHQHRRKGPAEFVVVRHPDDVELPVGIGTEEAAEEVEERTDVADDPRRTRIGLASVLIHVEGQLDSVHGYRAGAVFGERNAQRRHGLPPLPAGSPRIAFHVFVHGSAGRQRGQLFRVAQRQVEGVLVLAGMHGQPLLVVQQAEEVAAAVPEDVPFVPEGQRGGAAPRNWPEKRNGEIAPLPREQGAPAVGVVHAKDVECRIQRERRRGERVRPGRDVQGRLQLHALAVMRQRPRDPVVIQGQQRPPDHLVLPGLVCPIRPETAPHHGGTDLRVPGETALLHQADRFRFIGTVRVDQPPVRVREIDFRLEEGGMRVAQREALPGGAHVHQVVSVDALQQGFRPVEGPAALHA